MKRLVGMMLVVAALLLPNVAGAGVASKTVQEAVEFASKKFVKEAAEEGVERLSARMMQLAAKHGDDVVAAALKRVGPRVGRIAGEAGEHGGVALKLLAKHGDDAIRIAARPKALGLIARLGDDVAEPLIRHGDIGEKMIERFGADGAEALGKLSEQNVRRLAMLAEDQGAKVTPGLVKLFAKHGNADTLADYVWRNKGTIFFGATLATFVAAPEPFLNAAENVTTKSLDVAETVATETLHSAVAPIVTEAASQFPWGSTILIGMVVGMAIVIERIGAAKVIKSGWAMAADKLKGLRMKPLPQITPKPKENDNHDPEIR